MPVLFKLQSQRRFESGNLRVFLQHLAIFLVRSKSLLLLFVLANIYVQADEVVLQVLPQVVHQLSGKTDELLFLPWVGKSETQRGFRFDDRYILGQHHVQALLLREVLFQTDPRAHEPVSRKRGLLGRLRLLRRSVSDGRSRGIAVKRNALGHSVSRRLLRCRWLLWSSRLRGGYRLLRSRWLPGNHWLLGNSRLRHSRLRCGGHGKAAETDKTDFDRETLVARGAIIDVASVKQVESRKEPLRSASGSLLAVLTAHAVSRFEQRDGLRVFRNKHIAEMRSKPRDKNTGIKALAEHLVEEEKRGRDIGLQSGGDNAEIVVGVKHIEHPDSLLIGDFVAAESHKLVEDRKRIAHSTVSLASHDIESLLLRRYTFLRSDILEIVNCVIDSYALEVIDLTATEYGGENLVLLGGGEDEDWIGGRLFERLEQSIEGPLGEHVHLIDDIDAVLAYLRGYAHLLNESAYVLDGVVARRIQLVDIETALLIESHATFTLIAGIVLRRRVETVDCFCEDTCTSGFTHPSRAAEEIGMRKPVGADGIAQRVSECRLPYHRAKCSRTILACRNYIIIIHKHQKLTTAQSYGFFLDNANFNAEKKPVSRKKAKKRDGMRQWSKNRQ